MTNILVHNSSILGGGSASRVIVEDAVRRLLQANPGATVVDRDLGAAPVPHLTSATVAGIKGSPTT
jgi:FMN-dependent NADH-azoreductase